MLPSDKKYKEKIFKTNFQKDSNHETIPKFLWIKLYRSIDHTDMKVKNLHSEEINLVLDFF